MKRTSRVTAQWLRTMEREGAALGLSGWRVLLEGKYINDVFFEADWKGRACIVKCSSKCPWSIGNEYRLASRLHTVAPTVVAEPLAVCERPAFVVTERVAGPSLTELLERGLTDEQAASFAADILALARALRATGVLHRDLFADNLLLGADGHLKAIDWQLAIDRADYREDPWVERHWKFHYVVFGVNRELGMGVWNDFDALARLLAGFPQTEPVRLARAELEAAAPAMSFVAEPGARVRGLLRLYGWSLRAQMLLRGRGHRKYAQLERRWRTVKTGLSATARRAGF